MQYFVYYGMNLKEETENIYDDLAEVFHEKRTKEKHFNELMEMPLSLSLLGNVKGKKILDAGCGTGISSKILAQKGAKVTGIEISKKMLDIAEEYCKGFEIKFDKGSIDELLYEDGSFDTILASLVIHYFEDPTKVFKEFHRVLKKDGILVFSTNHPVNSCIDEFTEYKNKPAIVVSDYFTRRKFYWTSKRMGNAKIPSIHFTFEDLFDFILNNGFQIENLKESQLPKEAEKILGKGRYNHWKNIPTFVVFKCKKI